MRDITSRGAPIDHHIFIPQVLLPHFFFTLLLLFSKRFTLGETVTVFQELLNNCVIGWHIALPYSFLNC